MDWEIQVSVQSWMHSVSSMCTTQLRSTLGVVRVLKLVLRVTPLG